MKERYYIGGSLITFGVLFLLSNFHVLSVEKFWPIFVLGPGISFIAAFIIQRKNYGFLMPGTILTIIGMMFFYCEWFSWNSMEYLWPLFIIAPGAGFFALYFGGEKDKPLLIPAIILTIIGCSFIATDNIEKFWPIFVLGPGIGFIIAFLTERKNYGLLMPGTILTIIGILFFYCEWFGWNSMEYLWPFFIIAPGAGLFALYYYGEKDKHLLIPATILTTIGFIFIAVNNAETFIWPVILIVIGLWLLLFKK
jgi:hypothetical protein